MGPPCDPIDGWGVTDGKLHCSLNRGIMQGFLSDWETNKALADKRWVGQYGAVDAGPFNNGCYCGTYCSAMGRNFPGCAVKSPPKGAPCTENFPNRTSKPVPPTPPSPPSPPAPSPPAPTPPGPTPAGKWCYMKASAEGEVAKKGATACVKDGSGGCTYKADTDIQNDGIGITRAASSKEECCQLCNDGRCQASVFA